MSEDETKCETCKSKTISDCLLEIGQLRIEREKLNAEVDQLRKRVTELEQELSREQAAHQRHNSKCDLLIKVQRTFREPERTIVCDIVANASMLPDPEGKRYGKKVMDLVKQEQEIGQDQEPDDPFENRYFISDDTNIVDYEDMEEE